MGFAADDFPEAMAYYREAISLPMFQGLADEQQDQVVRALRVALDVEQS
jgi:dTDP-4-amino-4,6-dideoxygalactose transaminase